MKKTVLSLLLLAGACGPGGPPPRSGPPAADPVPREGQPSPVTITATRDFSVVPSGDALADLCNAAAARAPLHYTATVDPKETEASALRRIRELDRWVQALQRSAKIKAPAQVAKLHKQHGTILGHALSAASFARLREAPAALLTEALATMTRAISPYRVATRTPVEDAFKGDSVIVRLESKKAKEAESELKPDRIKEMRDVTAELERLAAAAAEGKLPRELQRDLVRIAASGVAPTLTFDAARSRAARRDAVEATRKKAGRMTFSQGQVILRKGEVYTAAHGQILSTMRSLRCAPCSGGLARCASGPMRLLKVGSISYAPILATRSFRATVSGDTSPAEKAAPGATPQAFVCDEKPGLARAEKLKKLLDLTALAEGRARAEKLRDGLKKELQLEVILQLLQSFSNVQPEKLRPALLELYGRAQATPLIASKPLPRPGEPCIVRRLKKGKAAEDAGAGCAVVPLARFRLQLPETVNREPGLLAGLPAEARKAAVELVQQLLVANTTFDEGETARRGKSSTPPPKKQEEVATGERSFEEGDVVVPANRPLTANDIKLLEQMVSLGCTRVAPGTRE